LAPPPHNMPYGDLDYEELTKILTDNFNVLADEAAALSDRNLILEHKLTFAHEQVIFSSNLQALFYCMMRNFSSRSGVAKAATTTDKHHYPELLAWLVTFLMSAFRLLYAYKVHHSINN
jgi:hypothetical protein